MLIFLMLALLLCPFDSDAQNLEAILETFEDEEVAELEELLRSLIESPLPINRVPADSLESLWFLAPDQLAALVALHSNAAPNITFQQIVAETGLSEEIARALFVARDPLEYHAAVRSRMVQKSTGSQQNIRFAFETDRLSVGGISERDPGEKQFTDFAAGYLVASPFGNGSRFLLGNFILQAGTGLLFAGPYGSPSLSQPGRVVTTMQPRLRPYRSVNENLAFHGIAASLPFSPLHLIVMHSRAKRDARVGADRTVISRPIDGLHISESQLAARNRLGENSTGAILHWQANSGLQFNVSLLHQKFSHRIASPDTVRQRFSFRGEARTFASAGFHYADADGTLNVLGEAVSGAQGVAGLASLNLKIAPVLLNTSFWHATPGFENDLGALPGNRVGGTSNESAFYLGIESRIGAGKMLVYSIRRATPWRTYLHPQPSARQDFALQWQQRLKSSTRLLLRFKYRDRASAMHATATSFQPRGDQVTSESLFSWRIQFRTRLHKRVNYRVRLDGTRLNSAGSVENGAMQTHEMVWRTEFLKAGLRYVYFSTASYATRIYLFEPALPNYLIPGAMFGEGERAMAYLTWKPSVRVKISGYLRYTRKIAEDRAFNWGVQVDFSNK